MKFLIDNNISRRICSHLEAAGHEAVHVGALCQDSSRTVSSARSMPHITAGFRWPAR